MRSWTRQKVWRFVPTPLVLVVVLAATAPGLTASPQNEPDRFRIATMKPFDEVIADLKFVITDHNFRALPYPFPETHGWSIHRHAFNERSS
jgi:hypothetical protein